MKRTVFVDTAGWLALLNPKDGMHAEAVQIARELQRSKVGLVTQHFTQAGFQKLL